MKEARPSDGDISVKIDGESNIMVGRQFEEIDSICSIISKKTIESLKEHFRDEMTTDDWKLVIKLKKVFGLA